MLKLDSFSKKYFQSWKVVRSFLFYASVFNTKKLPPELSHKKLYSYIRSGVQNFFLTLVEIFTSTYIIHTPNVMKCNLFLTFTIYIFT